VFVVGKTYKLRDPDSWRPTGYHFTGFPSWQECLLHRENGDFYVSKVKYVLVHDEIILILDRIGASLDDDVIYCQILFPSGLIGWVEEISAEKFGASRSWLELGTDAAAFIDSEES
jgi:hypothetical protein